MILALTGNPFYDYVAPVRRRGAGARRDTLRYGLGATQGQLNAGALVAGAAAVPTLVSGTAEQRVAAVAAVGGSTALAIMGPAMAAGPWGLAVAGAVVGISLLAGKIGHLITGCGDVCVQATQVVNQAQDYVQEIIDLYWKTPVRTKSYQAWVLGQLNQIFAQVQEMLSRLGPVGEKSLKERFTRGGGAPWCAANNLSIGPGCGGWWDKAYDPVANDAGVVDDSDPITTGAAAVAQTLGIPANYALPALAAALVLTGVLLL